MMAETIIRKTFSGMRCNIHLPETVPMTTPTAATVAICHCEGDLMKLHEGVNRHTEDIDQQGDCSRSGNECIASQIESQQGC